MPDNLTVATTLDCTAMYLGYRYAILVGDNHQFYAIRDESPYFCFEADTREAAVSIVTRAIDLYRMRGAPA